MHNDRITKSLHAPVMRNQVTENICLRINHSREQVYNHSGIVSLEARRTVCGARASPRRDGTLRTDIPEEEIFSATLRLMPAQEGNDSVLHSLRGNVIHLRERECPIPRFAGTSPLRWGSKRGLRRFQKPPHRNGEVARRAGGAPCCLLKLTTFPLRGSL